MDVSQLYRYYHRAFGPGLSKKQAALSFLEFGIPLAPSIGSPVCYQYDAMSFFEADVTVMKEIYQETMIVEEYRSRLVRNFAKAPSTPESKQAWAAFKTQYAQLVKTVTRAKTKVSRKNKEAGKKGAQKPAQKSPRHAGGGAKRGTGQKEGASTLHTPAASTVTHLAAAAGEDFELFEGDDVDIVIEGGGGERDLRKSIAIDGKNLDIFEGGRGARF